MSSSLASSQELLLRVVFNIADGYLLPAGEKTPPRKKSGLSM